MNKIFIITTDDNSDNWDLFISDIKDLRISYELHRVNIKDNGLKDALIRAEKIRPDCIFVSSINNRLPNAVIQSTYLPVVALKKDYDRIGSLFCPVVHESDAASFTARLLYPFNTEIQNALKNELRDTLDESIYSERYVLASGLNDPKIAFVPRTQNASDVLIFNDCNKVNKSIISPLRHQTTVLTNDLGGRIGNISFGNNIMGIYDETHHFSCWNLETSQLIGNHNLYPNIYAYICGDYIVSFKQIVSESNTSSNIEFVKLSVNDFSKFNWNSIGVVKNVMISSIKSIFPCWSDRFILLKTLDDQINFFDMDKFEKNYFRAGWSSKNYFKAVKCFAHRDNVLCILGVNMSDLNDIYVLDSRNMKTLYRFQTTKVITSFALHPTQQSLVIAFHDGNVEIINYDGTVKQLIKEKSPIVDMVYSCFGHFIAMVSIDGDIIIHAME